MAADLRALGVAESVVEDAQVVLSELMANAVRHARPLASGGLAASWHVNSRGVTVSVTDGGGATTPAPAKASPLSLGGRGLAIVEELSVGWCVHTEPDATTVHATIPLTS
jgi:anti-sigma regulatory factor (Ser/Thr protein kinase)